MRVKVYLDKKVRKGIVIYYPKYKYLIKRLSKYLKVSEDKELIINYLKSRKIKITITIFGFDRLDKRSIDFIEEIKHNIKELNLIISSLNISNNKMEFLKRNKAILIIENERLLINNIISIEPILVSITLVAILYVYWYLFALSIVIFSLYVVSKRIIR